jgi:DNA-binding IclR family transcriptional regulator
MNPPTVNEALAEICKAFIPIQEGVTCREIAEAVGIHQQTAWRKVNALVRAGALEYVKVRRQEITGRWRVVDGYRLPVKTKLKRA